MRLTGIGIALLLPAVNAAFMQNIKSTTQELVKGGINLWNNAWNNIAKPFVKSLQSFNEVLINPSTDMNKLYMPNWMATQPNMILISQLAIPGTHDTMAYHRKMTMFAQTQSYRLQAQFNAGIRYIDIRCCHIKDRFIITHGVMPTGSTFTDVLRITSEFLSSNPSEFVIMRVKKEVGNIGTKRPFNETFAWYRDSNPDTKDFFDLMYIVNDNETLPHLGEVRGKFIILTDFDDADPVDGYSWDSKILDIEDFWEVQTLESSEIEKKWTEINTHLDQAHADFGEEKLFITHLSGASRQVWPRVLALGDRWDNGMNGRTANKLEAWIQKGEKHGGIIISDFTGQRLVKAIIGLNEGAVPAERTWIWTVAPMVM